MTRWFMLALCASTVACATTKVTAFRDPSFQNTRYAHIAVFAEGSRLDEAVQVEERICTNLAPTSCTPGKSVLPPTRAYTADEVNSILKQAGVDGILVVDVAADQAATQYMGTVTNSSSTYAGSSSGTATFSGSAASWIGSSYGTASSSTVSTPVYRHSRAALGQVGLFDLASWRVAWRGEFEVGGHGVLGTTDHAFISSIAKKIASEVRDAGLVQ